MVLKNRMSAIFADKMELDRNLLILYLVIEIWVANHKER
ncbi:MAG: hypothetical protein RIR11_4993 [Bacteroidota bacterium]|jgi:hypothetical protein